MISKSAVLICLYGGDLRLWFQQAISSIVAQTVGFNNINIYLGIDGPIGSDLEEYIAVHQDLFYKICRSSHNRGITKTLNGLIEKLEDEEFVFRLDSDDYCVKDRFEKQILYLRKNPEVDVLGCGIIEVDSNGNKVYERNYPLDFDLIKNNIHKGNPLAHTSICFRRRFFKIVKIYPEWAYYNQDLALWFEGIKAGVVFSNIPEHLVYMRVNTAFYQRRTRNRAFGELKIYCKGIYEMNGVSHKFLYPIARFLFRLLPCFFVEMIYTSSIRDKFTP